MPVALITGAAQGIGETIARRLSKDGYSVAVNDLPSRTADLERLASELPSATVVTGDVSNEEDVKGMIAKTVDALGGLDVVRSFSLFFGDAFLNVACVSSLPMRASPLEGLCSTVRSRTAFDA